VDRFDEPRGVRRIAKRDPQAPHGCIEAVLKIHESALRPEAPAEILTADNLAWALQKRGKNPQRLFLEGQPDAPLPQLSAAQIELKWAKSEECFARGVCLHALPIKFNSRLTLHAVK
jgi:hypothetical protein